MAQPPSSYLQLSPFSSPAPHEAPRQSVHDQAVLKSLSQVQRSMRPSAQPQPPQVQLQRQVAQRQVAQRQVAQRQVAQRQVAQRQDAGQPQLFPNAFERTPSPGVLPTQQPTDPRVRTPIRTPVPVDPNHPSGYPPFQGFDECLQGLKEVLETAFLTTRDPATSTPPYNARHVNTSRRVIVNIPEAIDLESFQGGVSLFDVNSEFQEIDAFVEAIPGQPVQVMEIRAEGGHALVINDLGVTVQNGRPDALELRLFTDSTISQGVDPPNPIISGAAAFFQQPTQIVLSENKTLRLLAVNHDPCSALMFDLGLTGYVYRTGAYDGQQKSLIFPKRGYFVDCVRSNVHCEQ